MIYSSVGYCACGYEIWIEYLHDNRGWTCRYFDSDHREIVRCPRCASVLDEDELASR